MQNTKQEVRCVFLVPARNEEKETSTKQVYTSLYTCTGGQADGQEALLTLCPPFLSHARTRHTPSTPVEQLERPRSLHHCSQLQAEGEPHARRRVTAAAPRGAAPRAAASRLPPGRAARPLALRAPRPEPPGPRARPGACCAARGQPGGRGLPGAPAEPAPRRRRAAAAPALPAPPPLLRREAPRPGGQPRAACSGCGAAGPHGLQGPPSAHAGHRPARQGLSASANAEAGPVTVVRERRRKGEEKRETRQKKNEGLLWILHCMQRQGTQRTHLLCWLLPGAWVVLRLPRPGRPLRAVRRALGLPQRPAGRHAPHLSPSTRALRFPTLFLEYPSHVKHAAHPHFAPMHCYLHRRSMMHACVSTLACGGD